jgi:hypothetical protein
MSIEKKLPVQYMKYKKLFENPEDFRALPEHRPWDHEINLKEGRKPPSEKLRRHSYATTKTLEKYVAAALKKGWLRPSKSSAASNMLLAGKKGRSRGTTLR